jgi:hypothetical protein
VIKTSSRTSELRTFTPLQNAVEGWTNDDLLLDDRERGHFYQRYSRLARIFDWPELRRAFCVHEEPTKEARKRSRWYGELAVGLGFLGLALTAFTPYLGKLLSFSPLFPNDSDAAEQWSGGLAAVFIVLGTVVGSLQTLIWRMKREWLINRYWTERIRQFHFQLILNNLEKAAPALDDGAAFNAWRTFRQGKLADFLHDARQTLPSAFDELQDDHAEEDVWVDKSWRQPPPAQPETPELAELLEGLERQRIGVQDRYTALKLKPGIHSPQTRAEWLRGASDAFTATILVLTVAIGVLYFLGSEEPRLWLLGMLGAAGALTAAVVALRVLNEGLLLRTEAERYRWYLASVRSIARRFERANTPDRILLLRELERLAYQEMRRFLITSKESRFIM